MELWEFIEEEIKTRELSIGAKFECLKGVIELFPVLRASNNPCKEEWVKNQEHLQNTLGEQIANDMDYIREGQKYVDEIRKVLSSTK